MGHPQSAAMRQHFPPSCFEQNSKSSKMAAYLISFFRKLIQLSRRRDRKSRDIANGSSEAIIVRPQEGDIDQQVQESNPWIKPSLLIKKIQITQHQINNDETSLLPLSTLPSSVYLEIMTSSTTILILFDRFSSHFLDWHLM